MSYDCGNVDCESKSGSGLAVSIHCVRCNWCNSLCSQSLSVLGFVRVTPFITLSHLASCDGAGLSPDRRPRLCDATAPPHCVTTMSNSKQVQIRKCPKTGKCFEFQTFQEKNMSILTGFSHLVELDVLLDDVHVVEVLVSVVLLDVELVDEVVRVLKNQRRQDMS